jgi:hypothetical protein
VGKLPFYGNGTAPVLTSSATSITPAPGDSNKVVVSFAWSNPKYATDSTTQKFILEIDSTGRNFTKEITKIVTGTLGISFTGQQLNTILAAFGFTPAKSASFDVRLTSSYGNNNEQLKSNVITVNMTSYLVPITLVPSSSSALTLLVANATSTAISFTWNASQYGSDTINYAIQLDTVGGKFANPQIVKYGSALTAGFLVNDLNTAAIAAGVQGGSTKNVEFRVVSYMGTSYTTNLVNSNVITISLTTFVPIPPNLYIVGDATPGAWNNPVPTPSQQFTRLDAVSYGMIIKLTAGGSYLLLPLNGDWGHKYGGASATGGTLLSDNAVPGSNTPAPATTGMYKIIVNFQTGAYTVTPYTGAAVPANFYIVGDATPGGWNNPVPTPSQQFTQQDNASFQLTVSLVGSGSYLLLPLNGDWGHKFGGTSVTGGALLADDAVPGSNTPGPTVAGNYKITANFITNNYTVIKQ